VVLAGDKGESNLGLGRAVWQRLADSVAPIVDPAPLVNHVSRPHRLLPVGAR
jgi:fatty acid CoA ligase FadD9